MSQIVNRSHIVSPPKGARRARRVAALLCGLALLTTGCGPSLSRSKSFPEGGIKRIAVLPVSTTGTLRRERVTLLQDTLITELEGSGYLLLSPKLVEEVCGQDPQCPARDRLFSLYGVQALATLKLDALDEVNLVLGNYRSLRGTVVFTGVNNKEMLSSSHRESKRGGLLFNSGQVIEGLRSTVISNSDEQFAGLANEFVKKLVLTLPRAGTETAADTTTVRNPTVTMLDGEARYKVCAAGTPGSQASLVLAGRRSGLREIAPGQYCGVFPLGWLLADKATGRIVLTSPFGASAELPLTLSSPGICPPNAVVSFSGKTVERTCSGPRCAGTADQCENARVLVFTADSPAGPFTRAGELAGKGSWVAPRTASKTLAVVTVSPDGAVSLPILWTVGVSGGSSANNAAAS